MQGDSEKALPAQRIDQTVRGQSASFSRIPRRGGQGLANRDAVDLLKCAFTSTKADKADFGPALAEYLKDHGGIAAQTPTNWCAFIIKFVEERLDHHSASNSAMKRGSANSAVEDEEATLASMSGPLAVEFQAFMALKSKPIEQPRMS